MGIFSKIRNRKGFTLIEILVAIAIIIVLLTIAIPRYLDMTNRAKKARVAADFKSLATALGMYTTDWGGYPHDDFPLKIEVDSDLYKELTGNDAEFNNPSNKMESGKVGGIEYIIQGVFSSLANPFFPGDTVNGFYYYGTPTNSGLQHHWVLFFKSNNGHYYYCTNAVATLQDHGTSAPTSIGADGTVP